MQIRAKEIAIAEDVPCIQRGVGRGGFHDTGVQVRRRRCVGGGARRGAMVEELLQRRVGVGACRGAGEVMWWRGSRRSDWHRLRAPDFCHDSGGSLDGATGQSRRWPARRRAGRGGWRWQGWRWMEAPLVGEEKVERGTSILRGCSRTGSIDIKNISYYALCYGNQIGYSNYLSPH